MPDARSLFVGHHYSLAPLPAEPMPARRADARVGLMTQAVLDFSDDVARSPRVRMIERWRLEKKDPQAAAVRAGQADHLLDRPQRAAEVPRGGRAKASSSGTRPSRRSASRTPSSSSSRADDAEFDTLDLGYSSVRWLMSAVPGFGAIAPKHVDPRSGEILDADIGFETLSSRSLRTLRAQTLSGAASFAAVLGGQRMPTHAGHAQCVYGDMAAEQLGYALDVLEARGEIDADSPQAERFVADYVKDTVMHEVGHALGLRHNFRASRVYNEQQLADPEFTRVNGTTGSVMEYNAINLPRPGSAAACPS